jgi:opacity protein-like surface antigen
MIRLGLCAAVVVLLASAAEAQTSEFMLRGFADIGSTTFAAEQSFESVLGSPGGKVFGGGIEVVFPQHVFASLRASRFRRTGERVFLFGGEQFNLGIPTTVTVTPLIVLGGYRIDPGWRLVPYAAAGIGWHLYEENSDFAEEAENTRERFRGYHVLGGAEFRLVRWLATAFEAEWSTVPDALGQDPNSVSGHFSESDLGGVTYRIKVVIGS